MRTRIEVGLREMNQQFAEYIHRVEGGTEIVVTRRGKPIALVTPIANATPDITSEPTTNEVDQ